MGSVSDSRKGLRSFGQHLNRETLIIALSAIGIIFVYWNDLVVLSDDALKNEMASYVLALPFLVLYMSCRKGEILKAQLTVEFREDQNKIVKDIVAASLCLSALSLYIYGSFTFTVIEYHITSLIVFIMGCLVFLLGIRNLKHLAFPLGFLLLLLIPYRQEAYQASSYLSTLTSTLTYNILSVLGFPVTLSSTYDSPAITIQTSSGEPVPFVIDIPCGGAYSLIGFLVFALFFAYVSSGSHLKKAVWASLGFLFIYAMNIARVSVILVVGYMLGAETAMGLFHLLSGSVLIFFASLLMILVGEKSLKVGLFWREDSPDGSCSLCQEGDVGSESFCTYCGRFLISSATSVSSIDLSKILVLASVFAILTNVQVPTFTLAQRSLMEMDIHGISGSQDAQTFLPQIDEYEPVFLYRDQRFERISQQDASMLYVYRPENLSMAPIFASVEIADSYSKLHYWEVCLYVTADEQIVNPIVSSDIQILENPPLVGRIFIFKYVKSEQTVMILYWYEKAAFKIGNGWGNRYVKTSLITYLDSFAKTGEINGVNDHAKLQDRLISMSQNIINYREPVKQWSAYIVVFAQYGQTLSIASIVGASILFVSFQLKMRRDKEQGALSIHKQLVWHSSFKGREMEREILKVLQILNESEGRTGREITESYKRDTSRGIHEQEMTKILGYAEDYGLIEKIMKVKDGRPVFLWRNAVLSTL